MKNFIFITALLVTTNLFSQTNDCKTLEKGAYMWSQTKTGKETYKECLWVVVCKNSDRVEFRVSSTSVITFYKITETKWETYDGKVVNVTTKEGVKYFALNENKVYYYTIEKVL
jgi:hypothetical protein